MDLVTEIKVQAGDKSRVSLFLNDKFCCGLDMQTVVKNGIKVGTYIDQKKLEELQLQSEKQTAYTKALKLISTRYKTQKEVETYLYQKGYLPPVVCYVVGKLVEYRYVDDERYVDSFVASHKNTCGKLKLKQMLLQKGIKLALVEQKLSEDLEQSEQIVALAQKYMKTKENTKQNLAKLYNYLLGKGFEYEQIKQAIKQEFDV